MKRVNRWTLTSAVPLVLQESVATVKMLFGRLRISRVMSSEMARAPMVPRQAIVVKKM